jgi:hypothetical protein
MVIQKCDQVWKLKNGLVTVYVGNLVTCIRLSQQLQGGK